MQDRTINNALIELCKRGGAQAAIAEALLILRGVPLPLPRSHQKILGRSGTGRFVVDTLSSGPKTTIQISELILEGWPQIGLASAYNRAYQALIRLQSKGIVERVGDRWGLAH